MVLPSSNDSMWRRTSKQRITPFRSPPCHVDRAGYSEFLDIAIIDIPDVVIGAYNGRSAVIVLFPSMRYTNYLRELSAHLDQLQG